MDLDGTLVMTDTLHEGFVRALFTRPMDAFKALLSIRRGPAEVKTRLADYSAEGAASFPQRGEFVEWLRGQAKGGRRLHLVTAAHETVAQAVAARFAIFDSVIATKGGDNLKGRAKRDRLVERFPEGFSYAGDARADLPVFEAADSIVLAGHSAALGRQARGKGHTVEAEFPNAPRGARAWLKAIRVHQWAKNLLMFIPLLLSGLFVSIEPAVNVAIGFLLMGVAASGTYIVNDLSDLAADRAHATKKNRPFASGALSVRAGMAAATLMVGAGVVGGFILAPAFGALLVGYTLVTLSYSLWFKRVAILDVALLAGLYALRLGMGAVLASAVFSEWLMVFALFFFLSLSLAKRHVEIVKAAAVSTGPIKGRGYNTGDAVLTLPLGLAAAMTSLLVMVLFLVFAAMIPGAYANPKFLWGAPLLVFLWLSRVWLLASRGELEDDPVSFAVKDRVSLFLGALLGVFTLLAVLDLTP